jgi:hypothetical protein
MPTQAPTKSSTPRLSEVARHVVSPPGVTSTGWPAVRDKCRDLGLSFRWWQQPIGQLILAKRADGKYAATIGGTGLSIPRQVGKTFLVGAIVFALCLLNPGLTVIWTAHRLRTAEETFGKMQGFTRRKKIAPHILKVLTGSGSEEISFHNGSRILFGARERGFGRGFDEVDVLIFDEAQILTDNALDDMIPATNQSRQPSGALLLFMGTPPKPSDPGEVFTRMRTEALSGEDEDTGWVEFGADPGFVPTPAPAPLTAKDWAQVAKANPSYPQDTPREAILRMRKKLSVESFPREGLGIWDDEDTGPGLDFPRWKTLADPDAARGSTVVFGLSTAPDRSWAALSVGWHRPDGNVQVMLADYRPTTSWVKARANELRKSWGGRILTDHESRDLVDDPEVIPLVRAEASLDDAITAGTVRHGNEPALNAAVKGAQWRKSGDGRVLDRKGSLEISPAVAVALAVHGLGAAAPSVYEERELLTL